MVKYSQSLGTPEWARAPRWTVWVIVSAIAGCLIGVLATLLALALLSPGPQPASPLVGGTSGDVGIAIDDVYLTNLVADAMDSTTLPVRVRNVQTEILPNNQVKLSGDASSPFPASARLVAVAQLRVESGRLTMRFLNAQIGGLPLPVTLTAALEQPLNSKLAQISDSLLPPGFVIADLATTEHHLLLTISQR